MLDSINGHETDEITRQTVEATARRLEKLGHRIEPVPVPVHSAFPDDFALYWALLAFGVRANGKKLLHPAFNKHRTDGLTNGHTTPALGHLSPDVPFDTLFERLRQYVSFTPLANATGAPAISLPMSHTPDKLPVSVQFMGRHGGERTLLDIAFTLEADHPWPLLFDFSRNSLSSGESKARDSLANTV